MTVDGDGARFAPGAFDSLDGEAASQVEHTTGIGLLVSKWGVDELDGDVSFESHEGEGRQ